MICLSENALADLSLTLVGHGDVTPSVKEVRAHVSECTACAKRLSTHLVLAKGLDGLARQLDESISDAQCLDENAMAEYYDNVLSKHAREAATRHLAHCQHCVSKLAALETYLSKAEPSAWSYVFKRAKKGLDMLLHPEEGFRFVTLKPAMVLAANTAEQTMHSWVQRINECSVRFDLQQVDDETFSVQITVMPDSGRLDRARLIVRVDENIVQAQPFSERGMIRLDDLTAQRYAIEIMTRNGVLGPFDLTIE